MTTKRVTVQRLDVANRGMHEDYDGTDVFVPSDSFTFFHTANDVDGDIYIAGMREARKLWPNKLASGSAILIFSEDAAWYKK